MKILLLSMALVIGILSSCRNKEKAPVTPDKINASKLVSIIDDSSFLEFKTLVNEMGFSPVDSVQSDNGDIIYITMNPNEPGTTLGVTMDTAFHVSYLQYTTRDKALYKRIKSQFEALHFTSRGKKPGDPESEEFERIGTTAIAEVVEEKGKPKSYEFIFFKAN